MGTITLDIQAAAATHQGLVRRRNEDHHAMTGATVSRVDRDIVNTRNTGGPFLAVVADGLGGHPAGDVASRVAVEFLMNADPADEDALIDAVFGANERVVTAMDEPDGEITMGTTIAAVLVHRDSVTVINVGDSQVFELDDDDDLVQLSIDDSPGENDADYQGWSSSIVTQTIGGGTLPEPISPHVATDTVDRPRRFLLCTDGLTNFVARHLIEKTVRRTDRTDVVDLLVQLALAAGAPDNITVVVIDVHPTDHPPTA